MKKENKIGSALTFYRKPEGSYYLSDWRHAESQAPLQDVYSLVDPFSLHLNNFQPIDTVIFWKDDRIEFNSLEIHFKINQENNLYTQKIRILF